MCNTQKEHVQGARTGQCPRQYNMQTFTILQKNPLPVPAGDYIQCANSMLQYYKYYVMILQKAINCLNTYKQCKSTVLVVGNRRNYSPNLAKQNEQQKEKKR